MTTVSKIRTDFTSGDSCSHTYMTLNDGTESQITFDWTYGKVYCKFGNDPWITIDLDIPDVQFLEANDSKKQQFQLFVADASKVLDKYPYGGVPEELNKLKRIMN